MGVGGKGAAEIEVTEYRLSIHYGVCVGPVDRVKEIYVNDKSLNVAGQSANGVVTINRPELFGGAKQGGGVVGQIAFLFGGPTQKLSSFLAQKLGRTPDNVTGYRNMLSLFFTGFADEGFTWSTNLPSIPPVEVEVVRAPVGLVGAAFIGDDDINPAFAIYELMTNVDFGAAYSETDVIKSSFQDCADILRDEEFGISFLWNGTSPVEGLVSEILQTISATLTYDYSTEKYSLKLLRDDYDVEDLVRITPRNADLVSFQRRSWGDVINEVVVTWTNPESEEEETVTQQDASGFRIQKTAVTDTSRNYLFIRNQDLAFQVADRELRQAGTPLAAMEVDVDLGIEGLVPGVAVIFDWYIEDETGEPFLKPMIARVLKVGRPKRGEAKYRVSLLEDVFAFGRSVTSAQPDLFVSPNQPPEDVWFVDPLDSPFFTVAQQVGDEEAASYEYPRGHVSVFAYSNLTDLREIDLQSLRPVPEASPAYRSVASIDSLGRFTLPTFLPRETVSVIALPALYVPRALVVGGFLVIGTGIDQEICVVTAFTDTTVTVRRGCLDTIPGTHAAGEPCWEVPRTSRVVDPTTLLIGEDLTYKLLPVTSVRKLTLAEATAHLHTVGERMHLPLRPANVRLDGQPGFSPNLSQSATSADITLSRRNRITETNIALAWDAADVTPEAGQTSFVRLIRRTQNFADLAYNPRDLSPTTTAAIQNSPATPVAPFGLPARVVSGGAVADRANMHSGTVDNTGGKRFRTEVYLRAGTSTEIRFLVSHSGGNFIAIYNVAGNSQVSLSAGPHTVHEISMIPTGFEDVRKFLIDVTYDSSDTTIVFSIGPYTSVSGNYISVMGGLILEDKAGFGEVLAADNAMAGTDTTLDISSNPVFRGDVVHLVAGSERDSLQSWQVLDIPVTVV